MDESVMERVRTDLLYYRVQAAGGSLTAEPAEMLELLGLPPAAASDQVSCLQRYSNGKMTIKPDDSGRVVLSVESGLRDIREVFDYWAKKTGHGKAKLDQARKAKIRARLREGYTVERLKAAVDGLLTSAFHMGQNDDRRKFDDIELICRNGAKVEMFEGYLRRPKSQVERFSGVVLPDRRLRHG